MQNRTKTDPNRTAAIRQCQSERRKRLNIKTLTIEIDRDTHVKIKQLANKKNTTMQSLLSDKIKSIADNSEGSEDNDMPWSVLEKLRQEEQCDFTHVSLFTGCGGIDLGFRQAGFRTVFANDIDGDACNTYRTNLGEISQDDVRNIGIPRLSYKPDVLSAGFPCQPFSNAGSRKGLTDKQGNLYETALNAVESLRPRTVVFENVRGILSFKKDQKLLIGEICQNLQDLGYDVVFSLVDASKHHVPQRRLRVFIVGVEKSRAHGKFSFPAPIERNDLTLRNIILGIDSSVYNQKELMQLNPQALQIGSMVPEGGSWKSIPYERLPPRLKKISDNIEKYRWPNFYRRFHRDEIAGTITAAFKPENAGVWHPVESRIFSVREIARIQSFPDWFKFEGRNIKSKYQQIGNAVPPRLAYEIASRLIGVLAGKDLRGLNNFMAFEQFTTAGKPLRACDRDVIFS